MRFNDQLSKWLNDGRCASALLLLAVAVTYWPSLSLPILDGWDDNFFIQSQFPHLTFSWDNFVYWLEHRIGGIYHPVVMYSFIADGILWHFNATGMHLQNIVWHVAATLGLYCCLRRLGCGGIGSFLGALLWTVQPLRVESVSWLTERKDVIFGTFYFWGFWFGSRYRESWSRWVTVFMFFLALFAKPMAISLPVLIVLYEFSMTRNWSPIHYLRRYWPLVMVMAVGVFSAMSETRYEVNFTIPIGHRLGSALYNVWFYWLKTMVPVGMNPMYGKIIFDFPVLLGMAGGTVILMIAGGWLLMKRREQFYYVFLPLMFGYLAMLAPVMGLVPLSSIDRADRFSYIISAMVIFILFRWYRLYLDGDQLWNADWELRIHVLILRYRRTIGIGMVLFCCWNAYASLVYQRDWRSVDSIIISATATEPANPVMLLARGRLELKRNLPAAQEMLLRLRNSSYRHSGSQSSWRLSLFSDYLEAMILYHSGRKTEAMTILELVTDALQQDHWLKAGDYPAALLALADCALEQHKLALTAECFDRLGAVYPPESFEHSYYLGLKNFYEGKLSNAIVLMRKALEIMPDNRQGIMTLRYFEKMTSTVKADNH